MSKSVPMHAVLDGSDTRVGSCHPAKARILVKKGLAKWKGKRLYLTQPEPSSTINDGGVSMTLTGEEWDRISSAMAAEEWDRLHGPGPHVHWKLDPDIDIDPIASQTGGSGLNPKELPWPGLRIRIMKDHYQVGCVIELDSKARTFTKLGLVHEAIPEDEWYDRVKPIDPSEPADHHMLSDMAFWFGKRFLVDGEPWDPREHLVTDTYDSVTVHGYMKAINLYRDEIPKHWSTIPDFAMPERRDADTIVRGALEKATKPCGCGPGEGCSNCDNHHVTAFNELYGLYIGGHVQLDTVLALLGDRNVPAAQSIVDQFKTRARATYEAQSDAWFQIDPNTKGRWVDGELRVQRVLTDPEDIEKIQRAMEPKPFSMGTTVLKTDQTDAELRVFAPPTEEHLRDLEAKGAISPATVDHILTQPRCPSCGLGLDTDGDGDCPVCSSRRKINDFDHLFNLYQKGSVKIDRILAALGLDPDDPFDKHGNIARLHTMLNGRHEEQLNTLRTLSRDLPVFEEILGDLCDSPAMWGDRFKMELHGRMDEDDALEHYACGWVEVWPEGFTIYINRTWCESKTVTHHPDAEVQPITDKVMRSDQEAVTIDRKRFARQKKGSFGKPRTHVRRYAPAGEKSANLDDPEPRRHLDYTCAITAWKSTLAGELRYIQAVLLDPKNEPLLVDQPEIIDGLPTRFVDTAAELYAAYQAVCGADDLAVYTRGNVGFGFTNESKDTRTAIHLSSFKRTAHERPDDVSEEDWATFIEAMKTNRGRVETFSRQAGR